jgi:hypothetical protein
MRCPNCTHDCAVVLADRLYDKTESVDVCRACQIIWFDKSELLQLAPGGVLQLVSLFTDSADHDAGARSPLCAELKCPLCRRLLATAHDMQRGTRFSYLKCPEGHGRLLTFYQFLRAKNFVRALGPAEIDELRQHVRQVNCVNCGAPVDVGRDVVCQFCQSPIAILDPGQLHRAIEDLRQSLEQKPVDPTLPLTLALERIRAERAFGGETPAASRPSILDLTFGDAADPILGGLRALRRILGDA